MRIKEIVLPKPHKRSLAFERRCSQKVKSTGSGPFDKSQNQCGRFAKVTIGRKHYCAQHAGELALKHLINEQRLKDNGE